MKKIIYVLIPIVSVLSGCAAMLQTSYQPAPQPYNEPQAAYSPPPDYSQPAYNDNNNFPGYDNSPQTNQVFYDSLSPYGTWIDYPDYGYVWQPNVDGDFRPYATNGYWVYSDYGWTWASGYNWGWAPFHYGRWFYDDSYGWLWMPGQEWAPAWVTWGSYGGYYCWAPIEPRVHMSDLAVRGGWNPPANSWNVVPRRRVTQLDIDRYIVRSNPAVINNVTNNVTIINNITNNYNTNNRPGGRPVIYNRGPRVNDVENSTNIRVDLVKVSDNTKPGAQVLSNNQISVYRPAIRQNKPQGTTPAPRTVKPFRPGNGIVKPQQRIDQGQFTSPDQNPSHPNTSRNPNDNPQGTPPVNQRPNNSRNPDNNNPQPNPQVTPPVNQRPNNARNPDNNNPQPNPQVTPPVNLRPNNARNPDNNNPQPNPQVTPQFNQRPNNAKNPDSNNPQPNPQVTPPVNQRPNNPRNPDNNNPQPNPQVTPPVNQRPNNSRNTNDNIPQQNQQVTPPVNQKPNNSRNPDNNNPQPNRQVTPPVNQRPNNSRNPNGNIPQQNQPAVQPGVNPNPGQNNNQQNPQPGVNPALWPNHQLVPNNMKKPVPVKKIDTTKRRPNNQ